MARRFISIVLPLMEREMWLVDLYLFCAPNGKEGVDRRFIYILCAPNGKEEWLVDLYLLCVPNGKEEWLDRFI